MKRKLSSKFYSNLQKSHLQETRKRQKTDKEQQDIQQPETIPKVEKKKEAPEI